MKILIIANPKSGTFKRVSIEAITEYLKEKGAAVMAMLTAKRGDAEDFAALVKEGEYDVVIAAGGDGTVNEVINGIAGRDIVLGVLPCGTVNVFALETNIPLDPFKACDVILRNSVKRINIGSVNSRRFVLMVSAGFDAYVAYRIHAGLKSLLGRLGYLLHGIFLLILYRFPKIKVTAEGETYHGYTVIVSNMKLYAGNICITSDASFLDDDFEVCLLTKKGALNIILFLFYVLFKKQYSFKYLTFFRAKELTLESDSTCHMQADGDGLGSLPCDIKILENALKVTLP